MHELWLVKHWKAEKDMNRLAQNWGQRQFCTLKHQNEDKLDVHQFIMMKPKKKKIVTPMDGEN